MNAKSAAQSTLRFAHQAQFTSFFLFLLISLLFINLLIDPARPKLHLVFEVSFSFCASLLIVTASILLLPRFPNIIGARKAITFLLCFVGVGASSFCLSYYALSRMTHWRFDGYDLVVDHSITDFGHSFALEMAILHSAPVLVAFFLSIGFSVVRNKITSHNKQCER